MKSGSVLRFLLPVVVLSFLLGILSVFVFDAPDPAGQLDDPLSGDPINNPLPTDDPNSTTVLVLGIDTFTSSSPRLLAIWWATLQSFSNEIELLGLPTNATPPANSRTLGELFELNIDRSPTTKFINSLDFFAPHFPDVILILDEEAFASLVDYMGGAMLDGQVFDGHTIVNSLRFTGDDPQMQLSMQASLILSLSFQGSQINQNSEITSLTTLIPDHAYSSIPPTTLVNILIPILPLDPESIHIETWQP